MQKKCVTRERKWIRRRYNPEDGAQGGTIFYQMLEMDRNFDGKGAFVRVFAFHEKKRRASQLQARSTSAGDP